VFPEPGVTPNLIILQNISLLMHVRVKTAVNHHAASDGIFLMKAEQTPKQVRSNILNKNKRHNAVIQCREMDSDVCGTVCTVSIYENCCCQ